MKKSDISVIVVIYVITLIFFVSTLAFPSDTQIYPMIVMAILALLNTLYLIQCVMKFAKVKKITNDYPIIFASFQHKQFFVVLGLCVLYIVLMSILGFYSATFLYMLGTMVFLKVSKKPLIITLVCFMAMVYATFTLFLNVPLPTGILM